MIILDTNVISEIFRPSPEPRVVEWLVSLTGDVAITYITLAGLIAGGRRLPDGGHKDELRRGSRKRSHRIGEADQCLHSMMTRRSSMTFAFHPATGSKR
ncbi:PIN domain-containing protein [Actinomyces minihominis]|uniref:PIN domain-containing protein n=1 Tax=Actinomyces minihominis TaxID=2002838 RepID=UPI001A92B559|nr:PIN domain-containing protein [Actinomyces minihominis]